jgi:hypothetical protein
MTTTNRAPVDNGGGFVGGLASAVKGEQREVATLPMAKWEDVGRIRSQTFNMAGLRMWQIAALLFTAMAWAYTLYSYRHADVVMANDLTMIVNGGLIIISLILFAVLVYDVRQDVTDSGAQWVIIGVITIVGIVFVFAFTPVATWALLNMFLVGYAPFMQIIAAGWVPVIMSIVALSIVPDFQIGRFAWWRELTNQPAASSEKQVLDVTAIRLQEMEQEHEIEKWDRSNNALAELEMAKEMIAELQKEIKQMKALPPTREYVPMNHGMARAAYGNVTLSGIDQVAMIKFINEWETRGTAREAWAGSKEQQAAGTHISQPQWEMITRALKNVKILDANNSPLVSREEAFRMLKISQTDPPTPPERAVGG